MHPLKSFYREHRAAAWRTLLAIFLLVQFAGFVSVFSAHIDPRSLLSARDADASHIVGTAQRTRWYKDNGESAYGAFFYRLANTLSTFAGRRFGGDSSAIENAERAEHLTLMTMSLLALFTMSYLLMSLLTDAVDIRLLGTMPLTALFLNHAIWTQFVFRAHPDMLFAVCTLAAFVLSVKAYRRPQEPVWFYLAALTWGVCGMVKLTFVLFLPGLVFLWLPPFSKAAFKKAVRFYLWMLPSYLVLGFPQSFNFPRSIRFLIHQGGYSIPATADSMMAWLRSYASQIADPLLAVVALAVCASLPKNSGSGGLWRFLMILLVPFVIIIRQNSDFDARYYLIPLVALSLAWIALLLRGLLAKTDEPLRISTGVLAVAVFSTQGLVPPTMENELAQTTACRAESQKIYDRLNKEMDQGRVFVLDPYVPVDITRAGPRAHSAWDNDWSAIEKWNATGIGLKTSYAAEFTSGEPSHIRQYDAPNWRAMMEYYKSFKDKTEVTDPKGGQWERTMDSSCGFEIWLKKSDLPPHN